LNSRTVAIYTIVAAAALQSAPARADCELSSGEKTAALVELYTSEGCSSCPPADRQLSRLREVLDPAADVVPLAFHVSYWDYIGWKDPFAQLAFGDRHKRLAQASRLKTVYTPQFFVGGVDLRSSGRTLRDAVSRLNSTAANASIQLRGSAAQNGTLVLSVEATARAGTGPAALYLTVAENGLVSKVTRGENGGATLLHEHVVRAWIGPLPLTGGSARIQREIELAPAWNRARLEVAAFVQEESTGKVLQAIGALRCAASSDRMAGAPGVQNPSSIVRQP
jgi:hypothetical protein